MSGDNSGDGAGGDGEQEEFAEALAIEKGPPARRLAVMRVGTHGASWMEPSDHSAI
jgi:hypothetical protein